MKIIKKILLIQILVLITLMTNTMAQGSTALVPVINYLLSETPPPPYAPPANSVNSTTITNTNDVSIRVDLLPQGIAFEKHRGKIVVLEMFEYNCGHCLLSIPRFNRLRDKYSKDDVYMVAVESRSYSNENLKKFVKVKGIKYDTVSREKSGKMISFVGTLTGWFIGLGVPKTMVFSRNGDLIYDHIGDLEESVVDRLIQSQL